MYQILQRQQYGHSSISIRPFVKRKCIVNQKYEHSGSLSLYYPNKLYYNPLPKLRQKYDHPITTIKFDGVKSRMQHLACVTLHDGSITISKPSPTSTSNIPQYFNSKNEDVLTTWLGHNNSIFDCSWYNNGKCLATASSDGICKLWDVSRKCATNLFASPRQSNVLSFKTIRPCTGNENLFVTSGRDGSIFMWDCRQLASHSLYEPISQMKINCKKPVRQIMNGHSVYTSDGNSNSKSINKRARCKSLFSGTSMKYQNGVSNAIFGNQDGTRVFSSGSSDGLVKCWDMRKIYQNSNSNNPISHNIRPPKPLIIIQEPNVIPFTNDKKTWLGSRSLFVDGKSIDDANSKKLNFADNYDSSSYRKCLLDSNNKDGCRSDFDAAKSVITARKYPFNCKFHRKNHGIASIDLDPTYSKLLVSYLNQPLHVYDLAGCVERNRPKKYGGYSYCCKSFFIKSSWTSDGKYIVSGSSNGMGYLWKGETTKVLSKAGEYNSNAILSPSFVFPVCNDANDEVSNVIGPDTGNSIKDLSFVATASISRKENEIKFWDLYNSEYNVDTDHFDGSGCFNDHNRRRARRKKRKRS